MNITAKSSKLIVAALLVIMFLDLIIIVSNSQPTNGTLSKSTRILLALAVIVFAMTIAIVVVLTINFFEKKRVCLEVFLVAPCDLSWERAEPFLRRLQREARLAQNLATERFDTARRREEEALGVLEFWKIPTTDPSNGRTP